MTPYERALIRLTRDISITLTAIRNKVEAKALDIYDGQDPITQDQLKTFDDILRTIARLSNSMDA